MGEREKGRGSGRQKTRNKNDRSFIGLSYKWERRKDEEMRMGIRPGLIFDGNGGCPVSCSPASGGRFIFSANTK